MLLVERDVYGEMIFIAIVSFRKLLVILVISAAHRYQTKYNKGLLELHL